MSQTMNGHSLEKNQWQRLKPISSAAWQCCSDPGKELSSSLSDQKKNLIDLTEARMDTDKWNIDTAEAVWLHCLWHPGMVWNSFLICCWLSMSILHIYMQHSCSGSPGACRAVVLTLLILYVQIAIVFAVQFNIWEKCNLPHKSYEPRSNRLEKCLRKIIRFWYVKTKERKTIGRLIPKWTKWWKSPLLCWDCSCKLCTICYFPL